MASIRQRPRKDGTVCYSVLYAIDGRQSSLPFDDEKSAEAFRQLIDVHGAARALEMYGLDAAPRRRDERTVLTVTQWLEHHIDHLSGVESRTTSARLLSN